MTEPKVGKNRGNAGKGRPKGSSNKVTKTIREAIESSFEEVGGADYLARMAVNQPSAYMALLGKVLPAHMNITAKDTKFTVVVERASAADKPDTD